jgi:putative spermidine/putrescine transport system ATP-binding protein
MQLSGGSIWLDATRIDTLPPGKARLRHGLPELRVVSTMTVAKNVGFGLRMRGLPDAEIAPSRMR